MYYVGEPSVRGGELRSMSRAYNHATDLAVGRMAKEARELRAHGVVGVRLSFVRHEWGEDCVEVRVVGTAVLTAGSRTQRPWMSDLSGQEWWMLQRAGFEAVGLVYAHTAWLAVTTAADRQIERNRENKEFRHWSSAWKRSRDIAGVRVQEMAQELDADGVVGVHLSRRVEDIELEGAAEHLLTLSVIGTAVRHVPGKDETAAHTRPVVSLRSGRLEPTLRVSAPAAVVE